MGTNTPNRNRIDRTAADQSLSDGLQKHAATIPPIFVAGAAVPATAIVAALQARIDSGKAAVATRATWSAAVQADRNELAGSNPLVSACKQTLLLVYAGQADTLADFGLKPRKPRVVTPETQVAAAQKAKATRQARHTLGKKQKAKITGTVAPTAPATPAPTASPPSGAPTGNAPAGGTTTHS
jgi:hypothetical protein